MKTEKLNNEVFESLPLILNEETLDELLGVGQQFVYDFMRVDDFPAFEVGGRLVVEKYHYLHWVESKYKTIHPNP